MSTRLRRWPIPGRRLWHLKRARLMRTVALVGVPLAVVLGSGGVETVPFWIKAVLWVPVSLFSSIPIGITLILFSVPVLYILDKLFPLDQIMEKVLMVGWVLIALFGYVLAADLGDTSVVRLPTAWPNLGALLIMSGASAVAFGFLTLGDRLEPPRFVDGLTPPEPEEEFWSDEKAVGWRAWTWHDGALHGVHAPWRSDEFVATCRRCADPPSWNDTCGIYAVKDLGEVHRFRTRLSIVGKVEMWGSVIEHQWGYRASHAAITKLWVDDKQFAERISRTYPGVDVLAGKPRRWKER